MAEIGKRVPLSIAPGTEPTPDATENNTLLYTSTNRVHFFRDRLASLPGWEALQLAGDDINDCTRSAYSFRDSNIDYTLYGTSTGLFAQVSGNVTNITPLDWDVVTLGNDPLATTNLDATVVVTDTAHGLATGAKVYLYNVEDVGGLTYDGLSGQREITYIDANSYSIEADSAATSTDASGGGSRVLLVRPVVTAIANTLSTNYGTLVNNPIATTNGSRAIVVTWANNRLMPGDAVTLSGATGNPGGIPNAQINTTHTVISRTTSTFTVEAASTSATSTTSGGGASVVVATAIVTLTIPSHGKASGARIAVYGAASTGGIAAASLNGEFVIRNVTTNTFSYLAGATATSGATASGGANLQYQAPMPAGSCDQAVSEGWGVGVWQATGQLWGEPGVDPTLVSFPRIWSFSYLSGRLHAAPGGGGYIYVWDLSTSTAPIPLANAPTEVDWIDDGANELLALRGIRINTSDRGNTEEWRAGRPDTLAYEDDIDGIPDLISTATSGKFKMLFSQFTTHLAQYVGKPDLWIVEDLTLSDGLISPKARASIDEAVFWMGQHDFYGFDGAQLRKLPNNTLREYIAQHLNMAQRTKIFARAVPEFDQVWWVLPWDDSEEPNRLIIYDYVRQHWTDGGTLERTAANEPFDVAGVSYMVNGHDAATPATVYQHETGVNDGDAAMAWYAETNYAQIGDGDTSMEIIEIWMDGTQTGDGQITVYTKENFRDQSPRAFGPFTFDETTSRIDIGGEGRLRKIRIEQTGVNSSFSIGKLTEVVQQGMPG